MCIRIDLDDPLAVRTNYDIIKGRIYVFVKTDVKISTILVKLEGESRTQLICCTNGHISRRRLVTETHKLLYQVQQVFPDGRLCSYPTSSIKLQAGKHEFPFSFQVPLQNECIDNKPIPSEIDIRESRMVSTQRQIQIDQNKRLLPPSLMRHPGLADIRYFIKVTIRHPQIFKESWRSKAEFKFSPLEPARSSWTGEELKASIPFAFERRIDSTATSWTKARWNPANSTDIVPKGELHARLPWPAIMICKEAVPLRLMVRKLNEISEPIFLVSFALNILERVKVRVGELKKTEINTWVIANLSGLSVQVGSSLDSEGTESIINHSLWDKFLLPNTVAPSFDTCNIERSYELDIRVGLSCGAYEEKKERGVSPTLSSAVMNRSAVIQNPDSVEDMLPSYEEATAHENMSVS